MSLETSVDLNRKPEWSNSPVAWIAGTGAFLAVWYAIYGQLVPCLSG